MNRKDFSFWTLCGSVYNQYASQPVMFALVLCLRHFENGLYTEKAETKYISKDRAREVKAHWL